MATVEELCVLVPSSISTRYQFEQWCESISLASVFSYLSLIDSILTRSITSYRLSKLDLLLKVARVKDFVTCAENGNLTKITKVLQTRLEKVLLLGSVTLTSVINTFRRRKKRGRIW
jgi:hypothetical protein